MRAALLVSSVLLLLSCSASAEESFTVALPSGAVIADVMQPAASPRLAELSAKLQAALQQDKEWWLSHVETAKPGEPLAWDRRMGLTQAEYREFLALAEDTQLRKVGETPIEFRRGADGRVTLVTGESLPDLNGIVIDPVNDFVETPFGRATQRSQIAASSEQRTTGPWNGVQWLLEERGATAGTGKVAKLALGRRVSDKRGILYYDAKEIGADGSIRRAGAILMFTLKPQPGS